MTTEIIEDVHATVKRLYEEHPEAFDWLLIVPKDVSPFRKTWKELYENQKLMYDNLRREKIAYEDRVVTMKNVIVSLVDVIAKV
jgi:hypothetical protein